MQSNETNCPLVKREKGSEGAGPVVRLGEHPFLSYLAAVLEGRDVLSERDHIERVAAAHRAYCMDVLGKAWLRLSDGEYRAMISALEGVLNV